MRYSKKKKKKWEEERWEGKRVGGKASFNSFNIKPERFEVQTAYCSPSKQAAGLTMAKVTSFSLLLLRTYIT